MVLQLSMLSGECLLTSYASCSYPARPNCFLFIAALMHKLLCYQNLRLDACLRSCTSAAERRACGLPAGRAPGMQMNFMVNPNLYVQPSWLAEDVKYRLVSIVQPNKAVLSTSLYAEFLGSQGHNCR